MAEGNPDEQKLDACGDASLYNDNYTYPLTTIKTTH